MVVSAERPSWSRAFRWPRLRVPLETRERHHLAQEVRRHARVERERRCRAGVVEFGPIARRMSLYEEMALRLDDIEARISPRGVERLRRLLAERALFRDYGLRARMRDTRVASILADLEGKTT